MTRKLTTLTLKRKTKLSTKLKTKTKKQKDVAAEFDVPAYTLSTIMKKKDHYRDLYFSGQTDAYKQRQTKPTKEKDT